jgi:O-succinylbenzoic acid--CoA ligase
MIHQAIEILNAWDTHQPQFTLQTSGSTGTPSSITHSRNALQWSAESTLKTWFDHQKAPIQLCALPFNKAGGFMQLIRASVWQSPIWLGEPNSNPLESIENYVLFLPQGFEIPEQNGIEPNKHIPFNIHPFSPALWAQFPPQLLSITPMQFVVMNNNPKSQARLQNINTVLLGGQNISDDIEKSILNEFPNTRFIHTFGSTETASHFAGREIKPGKTNYHTTAGTSINANQNHELMVCNPTTKDQWITLSDKVEILSNTEFRWLGRTNLVINTGGVKVHIEDLENQISQLLNWPLFSFYCKGESHPIFGEQITLVTTHQNVTLEEILIELHSLNPLHRPKSLRHISQIPMLPNGKIDRSGGNNA